MFADKYDAETWNGPSLSTKLARANAAIDGICHCGYVLRDPVNKEVGSRSWVACLRCLGSIKQLT